MRADSKHPDSCAAVKHRGSQSKSKSKMTLYASKVLNRGLHVGKFHLSKPAQRKRAQLLDVATGIDGIM